MIQASRFLQRFLRQNIQDDDSMFELDGLEILTQKKTGLTIAECLLISSPGPLSFQMAARRKLRITLITSSPNIERRNQVLTSPKILNNELLPHPFGPQTNTLIPERT